jgi:hypothetical protein
VDDLRLLNVPFLKRRAREKGLQLVYSDCPPPWQLRKRAGEPPVAKLQDREAVLRYLDQLPPAPRVRY